MLISFFHDVYQMYSKSPGPSFADVDTDSDLFSELQQQVEVFIEVVRSLGIGGMHSYTYCIYGWNTSLVMCIIGCCWSCVGGKRGVSCPSCRMLTQHGSL